MGTMETPQATRIKHNNPEYGTLATPCDTCGLPFTFQVTHKIGDSIWIGKECKTYTLSESIAIGFEYAHFGK